MLEPRRRFGGLTVAVLAIASACDAGRQVAHKSEVVADAKPDERATAAATLAPPGADDGPTDPDPPPVAESLVRELVLSKIDAASVASANALVFSVDQGQLAADLCQDGCKLDTSHLEPGSSERVQAFMWLRSATDPDASSLVELQCFKQECKQLSDQPIAFSKHVLKTLPQPGKLTPKDEKKLAVTVAKLSAKDPFAAVSEIVKRLRKCVTEEMTVRTEDDNALQVRLSLQHPDGFAHLMLADVQIYFPAVRTDGVDLPPRARIGYASWKSFENPRAYAPGFSADQHDFKNFRSKVDKCLDELT
jgi:hypothetical protein